LIWFIGIGALPIVEKLVMDDAFSTSGATMSRIISDVIERSPDILSLSVCDFCERQDKEKTRLKRKKDNVADSNTKKEELQGSMIDVWKRLLASNLYPLCSVSIYVSDSGSIVVEGFLVPSGPTHALIYCDFVRGFSVKSHLSTNYLHRVSLQSSSSVPDKTALSALSVKENELNYALNELIMSSHGQPSMLTRIRSQEAGNLPSLFSFTASSNISMVAAANTNPQSRIKSSQMEENCQNYGSLMSDSVDFSNASVYPVTSNERLFCSSSTPGIFDSETRCTATKIIPEEEPESLIFYDAVENKDVMPGSFFCTDSSIQKQSCTSPICEDAPHTEGESRTVGFFPWVNHVFKKAESMLRSATRTTEESKTISAETTSIHPIKVYEITEGICTENNNIANVHIELDHVLREGINENPSMVLDNCTIEKIASEEDTVVDLDLADEDCGPVSASERDVRETFESSLVPDKTLAYVLQNRVNEKTDSGDARIQVIEEYFAKVKDLPSSFRRNLFHCLFSDVDSIIECGHTIFTEIISTGTAKEQLDTVYLKTEKGMTAFLRRSDSINKLIKKVLKVKIGSNPMAIDFICLLSLQSVIINIHCFDYCFSNSICEMGKSFAVLFQDHFEPHVHYSLQRMALAIGSPFFVPSTMCRLLGGAVVRTGVTLSAEITTLSPGSVISFLRSHYEHLGVYSFLEPVLDTYDEKKRLDIISPEKSMISNVRSSSSLSTTIVEGVENYFEVKRSNSEESFSTLNSDPLGKRFPAETINVDSLLSVSTSSLLQKSVVGHRRNVGIKRSVSVVSNQISRVPSVGNTESLNSFSKSNSLLSHKRSASSKRTFTESLTNAVLTSLSPFPSKKAKMKHSFSFLSPTPSCSSGSLLQKISSVPLFGNDSFLSPEKVGKGLSVKAKKVESSSIIESTPI
jgi:hypothetical protein